MRELLSVRDDEFDEMRVYERYFSYDNLYGTGRKILGFAREAGEKPVRERINIKDLKPEHEQHLKTSIEKAISSGEYARFVSFHSQFMYDIHSFGGGPRTNQRFLPWHRVYLAKFEEMLNDVMKQETDKDYNISIPYWNWTVDREIPRLLRDITPSLDVNVYLWTTDGLPNGNRVFNLKVKRFPGTNPNASQLPIQQTIDQIRNLTRFSRFSNDLEKQPHNLVHGWVGGINPNPDANIAFDTVGTMSNALISPLDPLFWLHHSNIDRIWAGWQKKREEGGNISNIYPELNEEESKMYPWYPEYTEPQTRQIEEMGYTYDNYGES